MEARMNRTKLAQDAQSAQADALNRIADALERYLAWLGVPATFSQPAPETPSVPVGEADPNKAPAPAPKEDDNGEGT